MYRLLFLVTLALTFWPSRSVAQDCSDPSPLCFEQFDNIQSDSTDTGTLMTTFPCGSALNGTLYEISTLAAGNIEIEISNVICDATLPTEGDTLQVAIFTSTDAADPCNVASMNILACASVGAGSTLSIPAGAADETYYVALYGDMDADDTSPAECGYNLQIGGDAVEFFMTVPDSPIYALEGQTIEIEGVSGVDEYLWTGLGEITEDTLANPSIFPGIQGTYIYNLMGTLGDCVVNETITIIVSPNVIPIEIITPNGDGINDTWQIVNLDQRFPNAEILVFDRWGQQVFKSVGYGVEREWDGTNKNGDRLAMGAYFYVINLNVEGVSSEPFIGDISIIY